MALRAASLQFALDCDPPDTHDPQEAPPPEVLAVPTCKRSATMKACIGLSRIVGPGLLLHNLRGVTPAMELAQLGQLPQQV